jgi:putative phosphoesterase
MVQIGLLSDTHSFLDQSVFNHFKNVDEIWHAGDFGNSVLDQLTGFKPLRSVWGNIDGQDIRQKIPETAFFITEEVPVLMIHIGGYPGKYTRQAKELIICHEPKLFISGHSHILKVIFDDKHQCLHINPGAAGHHGWHTQRTIVRFAIDGNHIRNLEIIELGKRGAIPVALNK